MAAPAHFRPDTRQALLRAVTLYEEKTGSDFWPTDKLLSDANWRLRLARNRKELDIAVEQCADLFIRTKSERTDRRRPSAELLTPKTPHSPQIEGVIEEALKIRTKVFGVEILPSDQQLDNAYKDAESGYSPEEIATRDFHPVSSSTL